MHAIKGGWVGQTFALAKCNESGGKKSRIRRSKEERKSLVESFIKTHQKLNNGSFPSLNLTHKEVGGSFYTVREIVREVIQENKVLGPGNPDEIFEQHLIGSFSVETEKELSAANGYPPSTRIFPHHITSEELVPSANLEGRGDGLYLDVSSEIFQNNEEHEQAMAVVSEERENLVLEEGVEETEATNVEVTDLESALMVEISPLTYELDDNIGVLNGNAGDKEGHISAVDGMNFLQNGSNLRNELNNASLEDPQLSYALADENVGKAEVPVEENLDNYKAKEGTDIVLNYHQDGSEKPILNSDTRSRENGHQNFGEGLENSGLAKASEKNEEHENVRIDFGDKEISKLEGKSNNGGVVNEILGKGGESSVVNGMNFPENGLDLRNELSDASLEDPQLSYDLVDENVGGNEVTAEENLDNFIAKEGTDIFQKYHQDGSEEPVLNASTQNLENEHQSFDEGLENSELGKASKKNEEHEDMHIGSGDEEILELEEKSINEVIMNENLGTGEGESSVVDGMNFLVSGSDLRNELNDASLEDPQLSYDLVDEKVKENKVPVEENLHNYMAKEGTDIFLNRHQDGIEEPVLISNTRSLDNGHQSFGEGLEISGLGKASENNEEHENISSGDEDISELEEKSSNRSVLNENLGKGEEESSVVDETHFQESASDLTDARKIAKIAVQRLENCWDLVTENPETIVEEVPLEEISKVSMVEEGTGLDIRESFETEDKNASVVGIKITDLKNGVNTQSSKNAKISSEQTIPKMAIATTSKANNQLVDDLKKANQTLDRMNLESWKTNSDKNQKQPTNPLFVYFKAFITAFVKFWSE